METEPGKIILTWDVSPKNEQKYFEFLVREFLPGMQKLGFQLTDAWVTVYGDRPQILIGAIMTSVEEIRGILDSAEWFSLTGKLKEFVINYKQKLTVANGGFQF
ncbi:MAG: hypothetical protein C4545_10540 [Anaerolineaceae bacterium]|jgi:hypothetical protein|nr:MAG: hypothetical protein C4545_10540 [Anaerolineaceae bacterium]